MGYPAKYGPRAAVRTLGRCSAPFVEAEFRFQSSLLTRKNSSARMAVPTGTDFSSKFSDIAGMKKTYLFPIRELRVLLVPSMGGLILVLLFLSGHSFAQEYQPQIERPIVRYKMSATLDLETKQVKGRYRLTWWNHTADTISDLYFHLYLNAFKNADSTFMRERLYGKRKTAPSGWRAADEETRWGWVDVDRLRIANGPDLTDAMKFVQPDDGNEKDQTVMKVALPTPLGAYETLELEVEFTSKLPYQFARTGFQGDFFFIAQWFPKIGVYEAAGERGRAEGGWNCRQFHPRTEFYADYGVYDVDLTVPSNYVVGATGAERSRCENADGTTTYNFHQADVHDFAWTACPRFLVEKRTFAADEWVREAEMEEWSERLEIPLEDVRLSDVEVTLLLLPQHTAFAGRYFRAVFVGLKHMGLRFGPYPYTTLTVVDPPTESPAGGMEYPTLFTGDTHVWNPPPGQRPESVTVHEFGHQFWYGLVGNNEFEDAWMDEGFTTYSTYEVLDTVYGKRTAYTRVAGIPVAVFPWFRLPLPAFPWAGVGAVPVGDYLFPSRTSWKTRSRARYIENAEYDTLVRNGWEYIGRSSYYANSYRRVALTLWTLEGLLGKDVMARVLRTYHQRWRFRHPAPADFFAVVEEAAGEVSDKDIQSYIRQLFYTAESLDYAVTDIRNIPIRKVGVYEEGPDKRTGKKTYQQDETEKEFQARKEKRYRSTVLVRRLKGMRLPVDIDVHFENGEKVRKHWDGQYRWTKLVFEDSPKVTHAVVDPEGKLALDENRTNNSFQVTRDHRGADKWYLRWVFWLQNIFFAFSFFG